MTSSTSQTSGTSLTFYGGAGEIGGNKFLLQTPRSKIYLDFGESFDFGQDYFYEWLEPRAANGLECYFEFGIVPMTPKLYSRAQLQFTDLPYEKPDIDGVFLSHHHSDHIGHLSFLDEDIPLYLGHGTKAIIDAYSSLFPSLVNIGEHNSITLFKSGDTIRLKDLTVRPIHVDHSTPGAYAYIIETPSGNIAFTGDFRRHGPMKRLTEDFISAAAASKPRALLCEGTRMTPDPENHYTEDQVYEKVKGIIAKSKGLVLCEFSMCNIDRFNSIFKATKDAGRTFVIDTKYAFLLDRLRAILKLPDPLKDKTLKVYYKLAKSREFSEKDYGPKDKAYMGNMITFREIRARQRDYVMFTGFNKLMELVYIRPQKADYIYSSSESFLEGEENEDQRRVLNNWLTHFGITLHKAHCSGHAGKTDLKYAVRKIAPEILIPIHTRNPEEFKKIHDNVIIPKRGGTIEIR
jgi:ribonuclease J